MDFAVLDEETKPTIHAVLESVHPDSISIFQRFDQDTRPASGNTAPRNSSIKFSLYCPWTKQPGAGRCPNHDRIQSSLPQEFGIPAR